MICSTPDAGFEMARRLLFTALVLLTIVASTTTRAQKDATRAAVDARIATALERNHIPGAVALAVSKSRTLYRTALGVADASTRRPMTADAIFRIASMTKPVTSVAALQLIERGRISLDAPVSKYLPELSGLSVFESFDSASGAYTLRPLRGPITLRHLLTHTSGLGYTFTSAILRDFKPRDGERYDAGPMLFDPGERWHYGTSTDWLGKLVERVSGQALDLYFASHIFAPLRMRDTFFAVPVDKQGRLVAVHLRQADGTFVVQPAPPSVPVNGGGGLFSTAEDYGRFMRMFLNNGELDGQRVLSRASVAAMSRDQLGGKGVPALKTAIPERSADFAFINDGRDRWGLGFLISTIAAPGKRAAGSLSWGGINNTHFWIDPARDVAAVLLMQYLPFVDPTALDMLDTFERGVYELIR